MCPIVNIRLARAAPVLYVFDAVGSESLGLKIKLISLACWMVDIKCCSLECEFEIENSSWSIYPPGAVRLGCQIFLV